MCICVFIYIYIDISSLFDIFAQILHKSTYIIDIYNEVYMYVSLLFVFLFFPTSNYALIFKGGGVCIYTYINTYVCILLYTHTCMNVYIHLYTHMCVYVFTYIYIYEYIYMYIYI
jgi:hypothetical protein